MVPLGLGQTSSRPVDVGQAPLFHCRGMISEAERRPHLHCRFVTRPGPFYSQRDRGYL